MSRRFFILIIFIIAAFQINAQEGSTIGQFLKIPIDARSAGMGEAVAAVASDPSAMFWNPSGLGRLNNTSVMFTHTFWFADINHDFIAFALPFGENTIGLSITSVNVGDVEVTTLDQPNGTGTFYTASDLAVSFTFARKMTDRLTAGISVKYVREQIVNEVATGIAFDMGTSLEIGNGSVKLGMALTNFGAGMQMEGEDLVVPYTPGPANTPIKSYLETLEWPLPTNFRIGLSFELIGSKSLLFHSDESRFILAVDGNHPVDANERVNFGAEYSFNDWIFFRAGYKYKYYEQTTSFGGGIIIPVAGSLVKFDYALSNYGVLDYIHRITLQLEL